MSTTQNQLNAGADWDTDPYAGGVVDVFTLVKRWTEGPPKPVDIGTVKAWNMDMARIAFRVRSLATNIREASLAHFILRSLQWDLGTPVMAPGTPPDPGIVMALQANLELQKESFAVLLTMAESTDMSVDWVETYIEAERLRLYPHVAS